MFKFLQFTLPSGLMLPLHGGTTVLTEEMVPIEQQQQQRERSLSPDSLEQRLFKQHIIPDNDDDDESFLSSSSSLVDSISIDQQQHQLNSTKTIVHKLTSHSLLNTLSFSNDEDDDDLDDDLDEIHIDQDEVNLLFSDPDDGVLCRLSNELNDIDDDYDDENEDFHRHILPLPYVTSPNFIISSLSSLQDQQQVYTSYHFLDPISEAASEEERRAAISIIRQKHKHSTSSSLSTSANGYCDGDTTTNDDLSTLSDIDEQNTSMDENSISQTCSLFRDQQQHINKKRRHKEICSINWSTMNGTIDTSAGSDDTLERLRNITKMFGSKKNEDDEGQKLQRVEKVAPSDKIKNTFQKFEEIGSSNGLQNEEEDEEEDDVQPSESDGIVRSTRKKKKPPKEHVPYHEMAEVKDKFEKGVMDSDKPRAEKRLDVRVQSGLASSKKQAFEQGEFEQEIEPHVSKVQIDTDLVAGLASSKKQAFEQGEFEQEIRPHANKVQIDTDLVAGSTSAKKQAFEQGEFEQETRPHANKVQIDTDLAAGSTSAKKQAFQQQLENDANLTKTVIIDRDALVGAATDKKAMFEKGDFDQDYHELGSGRVQADADLLVGATTDKKAKFESGQLSDRPITPTRLDEMSTIVETGLAQTKRSELLSKMEAEQHVQRSGDRHIDIEQESGLAIARREQLASLASSEYKSAEKHFDVTTGSTSTIKEQYMADTSKPVKATVQSFDVESGLAKSRATAFENPDETTTIKRTVEIDNELLERGVAKERVAMFKNLESGSTQTTTSSGGDSKLRVDNGNVVRESDKREEIYFEKGQTKQLVEQWKTKQASPERDTPDAQVIRDSEILQQGKAKNLVEMWKTMDKENTPPPERRGPRTITPPPDNERRLPPAEDDEMASRKPGYGDDKANIESGHAKAVRERLMQNVEQNNTASTRKTLKQVTPPPEGVRRKSASPTDTGNSSSGLIEQYNDSEEFVPTKGQAQSLKNRFAEFEKDALKVETASSKIKYTPKRFVDTPAPKQISAESAVDPNKCSVCNKTVYAMEKIEADKKIYHKSCFKCMHCKSILKLGNFTANDGQIYCKPHFLQLFAIKGNYSAGFGLNDHKARWLSNSSSSSSSPSSISNTHESTLSNES
ncbi:unnamed protein product [Rotaria sp. Silwood2]|nr:unnamed protein product [Rotaria sp. Silwood2]CAF2572660.1 unnamed protein product [Rotaria sp. Silwood2]CAF2816756.1 unnamed protein product [Rotaria sp. Silwood2]CAF2965655.1 unnamed protein product [Rotaria sp. Silwood2]CAF3887915.1 unnamed protein product [Rotaria sp. Silwood2]